MSQGADRATIEARMMWESYRDQAKMWRALTVFQLPVTALALVLLFLVYTTADTYIEVPERAQVGHYTINQLSDDEFVNFSVKLVKLITTFRSGAARGQFEEARQYLWEPGLSDFVKNWIEGALPRYEYTDRAQFFFIEPRLIKVKREQDRVIVRVPGVEQYAIGGIINSSEEKVYYVALQTVPRTVKNDLGIVAVGISSAFARFAKIYSEDRAEEKMQAKIAKRNKRKRAKAATAEVGR